MPANMPSAFTFILPAHNEENVLERSVQRIVERLGDRPGTEVVIAENGSADATWEIAERLARETKAVKVFAYRESNAGLGYALQRAGLTIQDIDWIEVNEAFATVVLAWAREFQPDMARVNPWGGAIAHGHPLGASGAGLTAKMLAGLEATGGQFGLQVMCIGHGMATATIIERID